MDSLINRPAGVFENLRCWQRVWIVFSGIWVLLPLAAIVMYLSEGSLPPVLGILLMLGIAVAPPALLYGVGATISRLVGRIRSRS
ncbi:MAG: hypothetical protein WCA83_09225 [Azonexus sp.]